MRNRYSQLKKTLDIAVDRNTDSGLANLTHFFQCHTNGVSESFRPAAIEFLNKWYKVKGIEPKPIEDYLPIEWDVPFPPPSNTAFTFVDLFAGVGGITVN